MADLIEKTVSSEIKYTGCIVNVRMDDVVLGDGKKHFREVIEHPGGVVIIPVLENNKIVLIRQWRHPIGQELIELPAGKLDKKNEDVLAAAKRELQEETGYIAKNWESLGYIYSTPGFCNEKLYIFKASDLTLSDTNPDYGEVIEPLIVDIKQACDMIKSGQIVDAKTIVGIHRLLN